MEAHQEVGEYFKNYEDLEIHKLMLEDSSRNKAYKQAISENAERIKGKIVLDVGAGTGILSVFCAQVGAAKVYAIEASETYKLAQEVAKENGFENIIEVIHSKVEDFKLPGDIKADILVSEWMGFYLFHEGMLDSVLYARDNLLKNDALMFPHEATLFVAPCSIPDMYESWDSVNGVSMKCFARKLREKASHKPEITFIRQDQLLALPDAIAWVSLLDTEPSELDCFQTELVMVADKAGRYQGIAIYFTCTFPCSKFDPVMLSTDPDDPPTHWKQTVIVLPEEIEVEKGEPIAVGIVLKRNAEDRRRYNIEVTMLDPEKIEHPEYCSCDMTKCILAKAVIQQYDKQKMETE